MRKMQIGPSHKSAASAQRQQLCVFHRLLYCECEAVWGSHGVLHGRSDPEVSSDLPRALGGGGTATGGVRAGGRGVSPVRWPPPAASSLPLLRVRETQHHGNRILAAVLTSEFVMHCNPLDTMCCRLSILDTVCCRLGN